MRWLSTVILEMAERFFLFAHFWQKKEGYYLAPEDYQFKKHDKYTRSHAVNSQKQAVYNPAHGGKRVDPDLRKEKGYETF